MKVSYRRKPHISRKSNIGLWGNGFVELAHSVVKSNGGHFSQEDFKDKR